MTSRYLLFFFAGAMSMYIGGALLLRLPSLALYIATGSKLTEIRDLSKKQSIIYLLAVVSGGTIAVLLALSIMFLLSFFFPGPNEYDGQFALLGFIIGYLVKVLAYRRRNYPRR